MGALSGFGAGLASTGVILKSKRDFEQQSAMDAERLAQAKQTTATGADTESERIRQRAGQEEERQATREYYQQASPGYKFPTDQQPAAPAAAPAAPVAPQEAPPVVAAGDAPAAEPDATVAQAAPAPTEQPMPASALPGNTFSSTPAKPPVPAVTPGGAASMTAPPRPASPAPAATAATAPAQPGGGRVGLLDVLAQKALARGDMARHDQIMAQKNTMEKEGFAAVAHEAMLDPTNVRKIEQVSNQYGARRLVPGTLIYQGNGKYSGALLGPNGEAQPFKDFDMLHAAMMMGVIAPPKVIAHKADENVWTQGPDGKLTQLSSAAKFVTTTTRQGDAVTTDTTTGKVTITKPDGSEGRLTAQQTRGVHDIMALTGRISKERSDQIPGQASNKPPLEQARVAGIAQNIFLSNPELSEKGLNAAKATEIAIAINDKHPDASTGTVTRGDKTWDVVRYGKGKDAQVYAISLSAQQPLAQPPRAAAAPAPAPATPAPAAPAVAATAPRPAAPAALPKPPASPLDRMGQQAEQLKLAAAEARARLASVGARALKSDPEAANRIRAEVLQLESAYKSAQAEYERQAGSQAAVTGRVLK